MPLQDSHHLFFGESLAPDSLSPVLEILIDLDQVRGRGPLSQDYTIATTLLREEKIGGGSRTLCKFADNPPGPLFAHIIPEKSEVTVRADASR